MALLGNIIKNLENKLNVNIHGEYDNNEYIGAVSFLTKKNVEKLDLEREFLYIGYYNDYKNIKIKKNIILLDNNLEKNTSNYNGFLVDRKSTRLNSSHANI